MPTLQVKDLLKLAVPGEPRLSPAADFVAYTITRLDGERDCYTADLYVTSVAGGTPRQIVAGGGYRVSQPSWSPDASAIAFLWDRSGVNQIWVVPLQTERPHRLTSGGAVTAFCWSPDGQCVAYCAHPEATRRAGRILEYEIFPIKRDGLGYLAPEGPSLYVVSATGHEPRLVSGGPYTHAAPKFSPDGRWLACARVPHFNASDRGGGEVWLVPVAGGEGRAVAGEVDFHTAPTLDWCPDGRNLVYVTSHMQVSGRTPELRKVDVETRRQLSLTASLDRFVNQGTDSDLSFGAGPSHVAVDSHHAYFIAGDGGHTPLFRAPLDGLGAVQQVTSYGKHTVSEFSLGPGGRVAFTAMSDLSPNEVFFLDRQGAPRRLTAVGDGFWGRQPLEAVEPFSITLDGTFEAEGWIRRPGGASGPVPAILHIHGGPHQQFGYALDFRHALWVVRGWAVITLNPPGSSGYGSDFAGAIRGDWGGLDYLYHMASLDACITRRWVRPDRLAVAGTSYGGYMTSLIVTRTDRFCCAISESGITNLYSQAGTADNGPLNLTRFFDGVPPWGKGSEYLARSPIDHADRIHTPLLITHAACDDRVPFTQAEELYTALKYLGREVTLVRYPLDSHNFSTRGIPSNRLDVMERQLRWFGRFLTTD